jgi:hypothetical protein
LDYQKHPPYAFSEELGYDETCFDGLPQPNLVRQDAASFRDAAEREDDRVYLVWVRVDSSAPLSCRVAAVLVGSSEPGKIFGEQPAMDRMRAVHVRFARPQTSSCSRSLIFYSN